MTLEEWRERIQKVSDGIRGSTDSSAYQAKNRRDFYNRQAQEGAAQMQKAQDSQKFGAILGEGLKTTLIQSQQLPGYLVRGAAEGSAIVGDTGAKIMGGIERAGYQAIGQGQTGQMLADKRRARQARTVASARETADRISGIAPEERNFGEKLASASSQVITKANDASNLQRAAAVGNLALDVATAGSSRAFGAARAARIAKVSDNANDYNRAYQATKLAKDTERQVRRRVVSDAAVGGVAGGIGAYEEEDTKATDVIAGIAGGTVLGGLLSSGRFKEARKYNESVDQLQNNKYFGKPNTPQIPSFRGENRNVPKTAPKDLVLNEKYRLKVPGLGDGGLGDSGAIYIGKTDAPATRSTGAKEVAKQSQEELPTRDYGTGEPLVYEPIKDPSRSYPRNPKTPKDGRLVVLRDKDGNTFQTTPQEIGMSWKDINNKKGKRGQISVPGEIFGTKNGSRFNVVETIEAPLKVPGAKDLNNDKGLDGLPSIYPDPDFEMANAKRNRDNEPITYGKLDSDDPSFGYGGESKKEELFTFKLNDGSVVDIPLSDLRKSGLSRLGEERLPLSNKPRGASGSTPMALDGSGKPSTTSSMTTGRADAKTLGVSNTAGSRNYNEDDFLAQYAGNNRTALQQGWTDFTRNMADKFNTKGGEWMTSDNNFKRNTARVMQDHMPNFGKTNEQVEGSRNFFGAQDVAEKQPRIEGDELYARLGDESVTDIGKAMKAGDVSGLSPNQRKIAEELRIDANETHEYNYKQGWISEATYIKNKDSYMPTLYEEFEFNNIDGLPAEMQKKADDITNKITDLAGNYTKRPEAGMFKQKNKPGTVDLSEIDDPIYAIKKRKQQTLRNAAILDYSNSFSIDDTRVLRDVPPGSKAPAGYVKLSENKGYGNLSGKYVREDVMQDFAGFQFQNQIFDKMYDIGKALNRNELIQFRKATLTVLNIGVGLSNIGSNFPFTYLAGGNPFQVGSLTLRARAAIKGNTGPARYLQEKGLMGVNTLSEEMVKKKSMKAMGYEPNKKNIGQKGLAAVESGTNFAGNIYSGVDDVTKVALFMHLLEHRKLPVEEATRRVSEGLQNYNMVPRAYDVWSKTPFMGDPFIKFAGDALRIGAAGIRNNPIAMAGFLGSIAAVSYGSSVLSGENKEEREMRQNRLGSKKIELGVGSISPTLMVGDTEVDLSRMFVPIGGINRPTVGDPNPLVGLLDNFSPYPIVDVTAPFRDSRIPDSEKGKTAMNQLLSRGPISGGAVNLLFDQDFRGRSISDPNNSGKFNNSPLTEREKQRNQLIFAIRNTIPPIIDQQIDTVNSFRGKPDKYGRVRDPLSTIIRPLGIKTEKFDSERKFSDVDRQIKSTEFAERDVRSKLRANEKSDVDDKTREFRIETFNQDIEDILAERKRLEYIRSQIRLQ